jgi:outer membrane protein OmpA-like peptidoglycan-associated protein
MRPLRTLSAGLAIATLLVVPGLARAQRAPSGVAVGASVLFPSTSLGGGVLVGGAATGTIGLTARTSFEVSYAQYGTKLSEYASGDNRLRSLTLPSALLRVPVMGQDGANELSLLLGGAAQFYRLRQSNLGPETAVSEAIPSLGAGAALRMPLFGVLAADFSVRDWMAFSHGQEFSATRLARGLGHSLELRVSLSALFRKREPALATFEDLPVSFTSDFRPVDASTVQREPLRTTAGRDHIHTDAGTSVGVKAVDMSEFSGDKSPTGVSVLVPTEPMPQYDDVVIGTVFYTSGSADVRPAFRSLLNDIATYLRQNPTTQLVLRGYTDPSGAMTGNLSLAERRGTDLSELLTRMYGIPAGRMSVTSNGIDYKTKRDEVARRVDLVARTPKR